MSVDKANKAELEAIIMQFKLPDLAKLLESAGRNKYGRKVDLQKRALNMISDKVSIPLEMKIRNIYRQTQCFERQTSNAFPISRDSNAQRDHTDTSSCNGETYHIGINDKHFDYSLYLESGLSIPDSQCLSELRFKKLTFYSFVKDVVPITAVIPFRKTTDVFEYESVFQLADSDHKSLKESSEECGALQLQLRFGLLDQTTVNSKLLDDALPVALTVLINERYVQLPPPIPSTNKQGMLLKRFNFPINITPQCSRKNRLNKVSVSFTTESKLLYAFAIYLVEKLSADELISQIETRSAEITKEYISKKLQKDEDVEATSLKVSVLCPLSKMRMKLPCRASTCDHLQCFDAVFYIKLNEVKSVWQCPVCSKTCLYQNLFIDGFFSSILNCPSLPEGQNEIHINSDCSWKCVLEQKRSCPGDTGASGSKNRKIEAESDHEELEIVDNCESSSESIPERVLEESTPRLTISDTTEPENILVDLISDDDESEMKSSTDYSSTTFTSSTNHIPPVYDISDSD